MLPIAIPFSITIASYIKRLTLFHVASEPTYFTLGGDVSSPPSNFVIFKDRDLKFGDDVYF
jgi:hypothetical protein